MNTDYLTNYSEYSTPSPGVRDLIFNHCMNMINSDIRNAVRSAEMNKLKSENDFWEKIVKPIIRNRLTEFKISDDFNFKKAVKKSAQRIKSGLLYKTVLNKIQSNNK
jgi:hypothetical protein